MELRSDIATAASRMTSEYDVNREIRQLVAYLREGETVQRLVSGVYGSGAGLLAVTDERVLFLRDGRSGLAGEGYALEWLTSADWAPDGRWASVSVADSNQGAALRQVAPEDARAVVELIQRLARGSGRAQESRGPEAPAYPPPTSGRGYDGPGGAHSAPDRGDDAGGRTGLGLGAGGTGSTPAADSGPRFTERRPEYASTASGYHAAVPAGAGSSDDHPRGGYPDGGTGSYGTVSGARNGGAHTGGFSSGVSGTGFLPGGHTLEAGASLFGARPDGAEAEAASATTMTFTRPADGGPGWGGVRGMPEPAGLLDSSDAGMPIALLAGSSSVELPPAGRTGQLPRVPRQQGQPGLSGPLGLATDLVGEVSIAQLAAEDSGGFEVVPGLPPAFDAPEPGESPVSTLGTTPAGGFVPDIEPAAGDEAAPENLTAEGTERPKPISWRPPTKGAVSPLRSPKRGETDGDSPLDAAAVTAATTKAAAKAMAGAPADTDAKDSDRPTPPSSTGRFAALRPANKKARWIWLSTGAAALVGLAAIGSVKLLATGPAATEAAAPISPAPAAAIDAPASGPVVQVTKVLAADRLEVSGQYTGTVEVLGIVSPSGTSCGAADARQYAVDTLNHQTVTLVSDPGQPEKDTAGRRLAYVELPNKSDYSTQAAGAGMAKYFAPANGDLQNATQIKAAQSVAQEDKDGLWGPPCQGQFSGSSASTASTSGTAGTAEDDTSDGTEGDGTESSESSSGSTASSGTSSRGTGTTKARSTHSSTSTTSSHSTRTSTTATGN